LLPDASPGWTTEGKNILVGEAIVEKVKKKSYCFENKGGFLFFAALQKRNITF